MIDSNYDLWYARLSHINATYVQNMSKSGFITKISHNNSKCEICLKSKMTKKPFPKNEKTSQLLEIIHSDICELNGHLIR
jgi:hypothetical protein